MATPNEKLAASLDELRRLQRDGSRVFASRQLSRTSRERLLKHGFLLEAMKGWLVSTNPDVPPGDTTPWFASFWEFCSRYCQARFARRWHLSPEQSLLLHAESTAIPRQVTVCSPDAHNNKTDLLFGTSFFELKEKEMPPTSDLEIRNGVRVYRVVAALTRVPSSFFEAHTVEAQVILGTIREPSELLTWLLEGGHSTVAGRLAGAFRRLGHEAIANEIVSTMKAADYDVRESDPFSPDRPLAPPRKSTSPLVARLGTLWMSMRDPVLAEFPKSRGLPRDPGAYLHIIDDVYKLDAYHSLSIEGYQVTPQLVQRVTAGDWDPDNVESDRENKNALAARGYWLAFRRVREAVRRILAGANGAEVVRKGHRDWYREMFSPYVSAGLLGAEMLAGYRRQPVFLRGSRHVPPRWEALQDAMPAL